MGLVQGMLTSGFDTASDPSFFCPKYKTLTAAQRAQAMAEMIVWTTYYESSWDPTEYSVDVGEEDDKNTWSVGLLQLSVVDQPNYGFTFGYAFGDLQSPTPNLTLGLAIMARQIQNHGKILIPAGQSGVYWSTLHPGGSYDKSAAIAGHVQNLSFCN